MFWQTFLVERLVLVWRLLSGRPPLSALVEKITWRKVVFVAALLAATMVLAQIWSLDMAFFMAGDIAFYCEIAGAVMFIVVRGHLQQSVHAAKLALNHAMRRPRIWCRRGLNARRHRNSKHSTSGDKGADDEDGWLPALPGLHAA